MTRFYRFSYVINGYRVRDKPRGSPEYFSVVGCYFNFWGNDPKRDEAIRWNVRENVDVWIKEKGFRVFNLTEGEENVSVPAHESRGLGFYRGYTQVEHKGEVEVMEKSDLRFRLFTWFPVTKGFECPVPV